MPGQCGTQACERREQVSPSSVFAGVAPAVVLTGLMLVGLRPGWYSGTGT